MDLIFELDAAVVGVEAKIFAEFQPAQPAKYKPELGRIAHALTEIRGRKVRQLLVVLAPEHRRDEIAEHHLQEDVRFLAWEEVLEALKDSAGGDPFVAVLIEDFDRYLRDCLDFLPQFKEWQHHLCNHWEPNGTERHRLFLSRLKKILPSPGKLGSGETYVGYYFAPEGSDYPSWFGFVGSSRIEHCKGEAALVVSGTYDVEDTAFIKKREMVGEFWVRESPRPVWEICFKDDWTEPNDWIGALEPFLAVKRQRTDGGFT